MIFSQSSCSFLIFEFEACFYIARWFLVVGAHGTSLVHSCCLVQNKLPMAFRLQTRWLTEPKKWLLYYDVKSGGNICNWSNELLTLQITHNYEANKSAYFSFWGIAKGSRGPEFVFSGCTETALLMLSIRQFISQSQ